MKVIAGAGGLSRDNGASEVIVDRLACVPIVICVNTVSIRSRHALWLLASTELSAATIAAALHNGKKDRFDGCDVMVKVKVIVSGRNASRSTMFLLYKVRIRHGFLWI